MTHEYGTAVSDFAVNDRVALHPGLDLWMMGRRYATVTVVGRKYIHVSFDDGVRWQTIPAHLRKLGT